jgi:hypothetical protein
VCQREATLYFNFGGGSAECFKKKNYYYFFGDGPIKVARCKPKEKKKKLCTLEK